MKKKKNNPRRLQPIYKPIKAPPKAATPRAARSVKAIELAVITEISIAAWDLQQLVAKYIYPEGHCESIVYVYI